MNPTRQLDPVASVYFDRKTVFSASQDLAKIRSNGFVLLESPNQIDLWNLKAPDFSPKLYTSLSVPRKKSKNTRLTFLMVDSGDYDETAVRVHRVASKILPEIDQRKRQKVKKTKFSTSYRPPDSLESKLMFVKTGKNTLEAYKNPKPHNFRPLAEDMPNIITTAERDPGHLSFKSQHLSTIWGTRSEPDVHLRDTVTRINTYKPAEPRWEAQLTLPKLQWPPKSASYTRHRRRRGVYSAFMDRVEEKVSKSWKMDDVLTS